MVLVIPFSLDGMASHTHPPHGSYGNYTRHPRQLAPMPGMTAVTSFQTA